MGSLTELNQALREKRYTKAQSELSAIKMMNLAFDKEKYDDTLARQGKTDKRLKERMDWATTEKRIKDIGQLVRPIAQAFADPSDVDSEDLLSLKKSIDAFHDERRYARNDLEKAEYDTQFAALNQLHKSTSEFQIASSSITDIRASLNNLVGEYKDDEGQTQQGKFSSKATRTILDNAETAITTAGKFKNTKLIEILTKQREEASKVNFVALELEKYDKLAKSEGGFVNKELETTVGRARTAVQAEDYELAYSLLSRPGTSEEGYKQAQGVRQRKDNAKLLVDEAKLREEARRQTADHHLGIIKSAITDKETGNLGAELQAISTFDTTSTNYLGNPRDWKKYDAMMFRLQKRIHKEDSRFFDRLNWGVGGSDLLKSDHSGIAADDEAQYLLLAGHISLKDGHYVWPGGNIYMLNTGGQGYEKVKGNQPGEFDFDVNRHQAEITNNLDKLDYSDLSGDPNKIKYSVAAAASLWLELNPEIENRRATSSDFVRKTPESLQSKDLIDNIASTQEKTIKSIVAGETSTSELVGIIGDGSVLNAMRSLANTNAKFLIEFPDGSEEYIRAKEWGAVRGLHSDAAQTKGMKIKAVTNIADKIDPNAVPREKKLGMKDSQALKRAKNSLVRSEKSLKTAKTQKNIDHYNTKIKETQDLIARLELEK